MSDESIVEEGLMQAPFSRRTLIKAGAIVGGTVWVAPVIDSFISRAAAASLPSSYSFVALIYTCTPVGGVPKTYRQKWDSSDAYAANTANCGTSWKFANCGDADNYFQRGGSFAAGCGPATVVENGNGTITATVPANCTIGDYGYHNDDGCCFDSLVTTPNPNCASISGSVVTYKYPAPNSNVNSCACS